MIKTEFHSYPDIENVYRQSFVDKIFNAGLGNKQWCITEKVHGANTQLKYDSEVDGFRYGKRTCFIADGDNFFHLPEQIEPVKEKLKAMFDYLKENKYIGLLNITIYGEIFGGSYPAKGVEPDRFSSRVQREVLYHPSNQWKAFDIAIESKGFTPDLKEETTYRIFLGGEEFFKYCQMFDIPTVPLLKVAESLEEALEYPNDQQSVVYKDYDLPEIEGNIMEGVVLRPWKNDYFLGFERAIIKNKNDKFKEKHRAPKEFKQETPLSELTKKCIEEASQLVNEQRLHNVMSKIGENLTAKDIGRVMKAFNEDVIKDYIKDDEFSYHAIKDDPKEWKLVTKAISNMAAAIIKKELLYK